MKRSMLLSTLIIGAVVALLVVGGTQAVFNDSQTASGDVNAAPAGSVDLRLSEPLGGCGPTGGTDDEITFEGPEENLLPGEFRTCEIVMKNQGTVAFDVDVTSTDNSASDLDVCDGPGDDFTIEVTRGPDTGGDDTLASTARIAPGASENAFIKVTFNASATNACNDPLIDAAFVSVKFTATNAP